MKKIIILVIIFIAVIGYNFYEKNNSRDSCEERYKDWPRDKEIPFDECHPLYDPA